MKKFIHKVNKYLLENYPILWNTKIVWMLAICVVIHLLFFLFGLVTITNVTLLHDRNAIDIFFKNGAVFFGVIISILLVVIWLINMFKNNAFKSFYPSSKSHLFGQFICYTIILFASTTFYYSYVYGLKTYVSNAFKDGVVAEEIAIANNAAMFFSHNIMDYTVNNRQHPDPLGKLYTEQTHEFIIDSLPKLSFLDNEYQFYSLKSIERHVNTPYLDSIYIGHLFSQQKDSIEFYYFRDQVIDVSSHYKITAPSFYNYSKTFYVSEKTEDGDSYSSGLYYPGIYYSGKGYYSNTDDVFSEEAQQRSQLNVELLDRNDPKEIKEMLGKFIRLLETYEIPNNIELDVWFSMIYHPEIFQVSSIIRDKPLLDNEYDLYQITTELTRTEQYHKDRLSEFYIKTGFLFYTFQNIEDIKSKDIVSNSIHIFLWVAFLLASIIFVFRVSGLRTLLFSIVATGVLIMFVSLVSVLYAFLTGGGGSGMEYFISYFSLVLGTIILVIPLFFHRKLKKVITGIFLNISIIGFVFYVLLIIGIISMHQSQACRDNFEGWDLKDQCFILIEWLGIGSSYILFIIGLLFIYFYSGIIRKWKALPEG